MVVPQLSLGHENFPRGPRSLGPRDGETPCRTGSGRGWGNHSPQWFFGNPRLMPTSSDGSGQRVVTTLPRV